jgi:hypothetical protein
VGFCWYIKRRCIERVGFFDTRRFTHPDAQVIDFCLRAAELGFKHILCGDTLVYHHGNGGCAAESQHLPYPIMQPLRDLHPHFEQQLARHVAADPARPLRRRVDLARLLQSPKPRLLLVTHRLGGGTEKHVQDLAHLLEPQFEILILRPVTDDRIALAWSGQTEEFELFLTMPADCDALIRLLHTLTTVRVHFHHLIGHHPFIAQLPVKLGIAYDFTLHDYYSICPQFNLTLPDGRYCGEPDVNGCNACLQERPSLWRLDIVAWRRLFQRLLQGAERVFGPSQDVINRTRRYVPDAHFVHLPHPELKPIKVLALGRIDAAKGGYQLESCAKDAENRRLPLLFRVLGSAAYERLPRGMMGGEGAHSPLSFSGPYEEKNLATLIAWEQPDIIYFPAQWPETYSYTLSAAMDSGRPILAPRLGAFEERLAEYPNAHLIDRDTSPGHVNDLLLQLCPPEEPPHYLEQYLAGVTAQPGSGRWTSALIDELLSADRVYATLPEVIEQSPDTPLTQAAIEVQSAEKDRLLQRLTEQQQQIREQTALLQSLRWQLEEKDRSMAAIYASTSWRLSLPVRWLKRQLHRLKGHCQVERSRSIR